MTIPKTISDKEKFCLKYLLEHGYFQDQSDDVLLNIDIPDNLEYVLVRIDRSFFTELAEKLRALWPSGNKQIPNKDGTLSEYPWRDSVKNLATRLELLWKTRNLHDYTIEDCLCAARKYVSQYEGNAKYMQILKYFIIKQKSVYDSRGKARIVNESRFADLLESVQTETTAEDWNEMLEPQFRLIG